MNMNDLAQLGGNDCRSRGRPHFKRINICASRVYAALPSVRKHGMNSGGAPHEDICLNGPVPDCRCAGVCRLDLTTLLCGVIEFGRSNIE